MENIKSLPQYFQEKGFYYGYVVLVAGTIGVILSVPGQTMGVSVYTEHLIEALGLTRVQLSLAYLGGTLGSAFILPYAGKLLDHLGSRVLGTLAGASLASFLFLLSFSPKISKFLSASLNLPLTYTALFVAFFCFFGIRHFGQGQLTMASRTMMGRWFEKKRGLMIGLSGTFVAFSFGVAPLVLTGLIESFGWVGSLQVVGLFLAVMALFIYSLFRKSPEHYGIPIDGHYKTAQEIEDDQVHLDASSFTVESARKTYTFWVFNFGVFAQAMLITAVTFNMSDIGSMSGLTTTEAYSVFLPISFIATTSELLGGYLSDRWSFKYLLSIMQAGLFSGLMGLQFFNSVVGFAVVAVGFGISGGLFSLIMGAAWPKLFGRKYLGAITGFVSSWMVGGSAIGPYLFSLGPSFNGDYQGVLYLAALIPLAIFTGSFFAKSES